jgi:hypothetical protein
MVKITYKQALDAYENADRSNQGKIMDKVFKKKQQKLILDEKNENGSEFLTLEGQKKYDFIDVDYGNYIKKADQGKITKAKAIIKKKVQEYKSTKLQKYISGLKQRIILRKQNILVPKPDIDVLNDVLEVYKKQSEDKPVPYICNHTTEPIMMLYLLKKNGTKIILMNPKYWLTSGAKMVKTDDNLITKISNAYTKCIETKKLLIIPLTLNHSHANIVIFNPFRKEVERFEPHGKKTGSRNINSEKIDESLVKMVKNIKNKTKVDELNFISPMIIHNEEEGFQHYEGMEEQQKYKAGNITVKTEGGFCCAWSYFYANLRLHAPSIKSNDIIKATYKVITKEPKLLRKFIRGQMKFLNEEINLIDKKYNFDDYLNVLSSRYNLNKPQDKAKYDKMKEMQLIYNAYILQKYAELTDD